MSVDKHSARSTIRHNPDLVALLPDPPETFTTHTLDGVDNQDMKLLNERGVVEAVGTTHHRDYGDANTSTSAYTVWRLAGYAAEVRGDVFEDMGSMLPCECLKDGIVNVGDGIKCKCCGAVFDREEVSL